MPCLIFLEIHPEPDLFIGNVIFSIFKEGFYERFKVGRSIS